MKRQHPCLTQDWEVLNPLVLDLREAVGVVAIAEIVQRHAEVAAAPGVARRRPRIQAERATRVEVANRRSQPRQRFRGVDLFDRWRGAGAGCLLPLGRIERSLEEEIAASRPESESRHAVRLLE